MKITRIKSFLAGRCLLVRVYTDRDLVGNGEAGLWAHHPVVAAAIEELGEYFVGRDPRRIEHHFQAVSRSAHFTGSVLSAALSAIDIALWDILGKESGLPVYQLLGGKCRDRVPVFGGIGGSSLEEVGESTRQAVASGYTTLRLGPFFPGFEQRTSAEVIDDAVAMVAAAREAAGDRVDLGVEIHRNLRPDEAITLAAELRPFRLKFYEDPLVPESEEALEYVAAHVDIPLAVGERSYSLFQFRELIDRNVASFIRADLSLAGGFTQVKKIAAIAESSLVQLFPHLMGSPVNGAAFAHLAAAVPNYAFMESQRDLGCRRGAGRRAVRRGRGLPRDPRTPRHRRRNRREGVRGNPVRAGEDRRLLSRRRLGRPLNLQRRVERQRLVVRRHPDDLVPPPGELVGIPGRHGLRGSPLRQPVAQNHPASPPQPLPRDAGPGSVPVRLHRFAVDRQAHPVRPPGNAHEEVVLHPWSDRHHGLAVARHRDLGVGPPQSKCMLTNSPASWREVTFR